MTDVSNAAIRTDGISKHYGSFVAVQPLDLTIAAGTIFGFVGPNGAGKTTTFGMLTGLLAPTAGRVWLAGRELTPNAIDARRGMGVVADQPALFEHLHPAEMLRLIGMVHGLRGAALDHRVDELLERLDLGEVRHRLIKQCSHGTRKRIAFAAAIIHDPAVLFLDEPFEGMDALTVRLVVNNLTAMTRRGATVFLTSHILDIVERISDRIAIFNAGRIVWDSPASEIRSHVFEQMEEQRASALERVLVDLVGRDRSGGVFSWLTGNVREQQIGA